MFRVFKMKNSASLNSMGEKMVASENAAPDICVTSSGFDRYLITRCLGADCLMLKWSSSCHRLLLQRCPGSPFIRPGAGLLGEWGVRKRHAQQLEATGSAPQPQPAASSSVSGVSSAEFREYPGPNSSSDIISRVLDFEGRIHLKALFGVLF